MVFSAMDYDGGVRVFAEHALKIDLAILDVTLPGKNGVDLAKHLLTVRPALPILFVSAHVGASGIRRYGVNATDRHFLVKSHSTDVRYWLV